MKRLIAILIALCLLSGIGALAQDGAASDAAEESKLPAPEEVAAIEEEATEPAEGAGDQAETTDDAAETADTAETADAAVAADTAEAADAAEAADEAEATEAPEAEEQGGATEETEATEAPADTEIPEAEPTEVPAEAQEIEVWFEEGFGLTLPAGWVSYALSDEDKDNGVRYALGDGSNERFLYVQVNPSALEDIQALSAAVENTEGLSKTGDLNFGDTDFVAFIDDLQNASCCATLLNGQQVVFVFTPQTDSDYMLVASKLMESFTTL